MPGSLRSALMLLSLFDLDLVEASRARRPKQANTDDGLTGLLRNRERAAFLVPTSGAQKRADVQPGDLLALIVVNRDRDLRLLVEILHATDYVFSLYPA